MEKCAVKQRMKEVAFGDYGLQLQLATGLPPNQKLLVSPLVMKRGGKV